MAQDQSQPEEQIQPLSENLENSNPKPVVEPPASRTGAPLASSDIKEFRSCLRQAASRCRARGLTYGAKWAAEHTVWLLDLPDDTPLPTAMEEGGHHYSHLNANGGPPEGTAQRMDVADVARPVLEREARITDTCENDMCDLALSYLQVKEYDRVEHVLKRYSSHRAVFLRGYALFLNGERRKVEETLEHEVILEAPRVVNKSLSEITDLLDAKLEDLDSFGLYLSGLAYARLGIRPKAQYSLLRSVTLYPFNWSAWEELGKLIENRDQLEALLPEIMSVVSPIMRHFFVVHLMSTRGLAAETFPQSATYLSSVFPDNPHLDLQLALAYYHQGKYDRALTYFEEYREQNPCSLDFIDVQSHILFTMQDMTRLSMLAQQAFKIDRYRPETCIAVGNYFSARRDHYRALDYFQRALRLRPTHVEALIMMGDEYMELKNSNAALETYRRAADIAPQDFRTWYGVGKAFDMLAMPDHALPYYQKAAACRPSHAQTWTAIGQCYEMIPPSIHSTPSKFHTHALLSYKRALLCPDRSPLLYLFMAKIFDRGCEEIRDPDQAAFYYRRWVENKKDAGGRADMTSSIDQNQFYFEWEDALTFLAEYYKEKGNFEEAVRHAIWKLMIFCANDTHFQEEYAFEIAHTERGKALMRELRALKDSTLYRHPEAPRPPLSSFGKSSILSNSL
ncbi:hypothetical protein DFS34DRAFT_205219 [Phlyctochytrium arcticum]|nr:hypothetical protein DFS34DRAFT_205219 [Phlyctochytrium arcticum]